jgi:PIN domain nuclease of toxin-antitoxin system
LRRLLDTHPFVWAMAQSYLLSSRDLEDGVSRLGFEWMDLRPAHAVMAGWLPRLHGDPFKKMLSAQALIENARF